MENAATTQRKIDVFVFVNISFHEHVSKKKEFVALSFVVVAQTYRSGMLPCPQLLLTCQIKGALSVN